MRSEAAIESALELALFGRGEVEPNPRVGAIALEGGEIVGRGWHRYWGGRHAEVEALVDAGMHGRTPDTVAVTLEPCSSLIHMEGKKTPPCTETLIEAGIERVIVGAIDPDPRHGGHGVAALEAAGIEVEHGVLADRCLAINRPFMRWLGLDRPWTIVKYAMTLDGKTAAPTGESRWISSHESRVHVHEVRSRVDAVVVGFRTARIDDPELTVRHVEGPQPIRIVIDPHAEIDDDANLVRTADEAPFWLLVHEDADPVRTGHLQDLGVQIVHVRPAAKGRRLHLLEAWRELRRRGVRRILVEGGGSIVAQLLSFECVDQVLAFVSPKMVGGALSPTPVAGEGLGSMGDAWTFDELYWRASGDDLVLGAFARHVDPAEEPSEEDPPSEDAPES